MKTGTGIIAIALLSGSALAGFDATQTIPAVTGQGTFAITGTYLDGTYEGGHNNFAFDSFDSPSDKGLGQFSGGAFSSFCIELYPISSSTIHYDVVDLSSAPNPSGAPGYDYNAADAAALNEVIAAAISLDWINADLSAGSASSNVRLSAIQGLIWSKLFAPRGGSVAANDASVAAAMSTLDSNIVMGAHVAGLRAMVSADTQDQLFVVPLPPAAYAGLAMLGGIAGIKRMRR